MSLTAKVLVGSIVIVSALAFLFTTLFTGTRPGMHRPQRAVATTIITSAAGQRLNELFDGVKPNPLCSLENIKRVKEQRRHCDESRSLEFSFIDRVLGVIPAYAVCAPTLCSGSYWTPVVYNCAYWGCGGAAYDSEYDPAQATKCDGASVRNCTRGCTYCPYEVCNDCG